jgi:mono/diheme cytochrome c family protein
MKRKLLAIVFLVLAAGLVAAGWLGYKAFKTGFSAKAEPHALEVMMARQLRRLAIPVEQRNKRNPVIPSTQVLSEGRAHFADHCATCHANDGSGQTVIGKNVYPKAPDMRLTDTQSMSDGELFFVIHNGIRFTAMPAWGTGTPENDLISWKLVHFIRHLPKLSPEELEEMISLNSKTKKELDEEASFDRFLQGGDAAGAAAPDSHHH